MKARQKGKQDLKRRLESKYLREARDLIKWWGYRKYSIDINTGEAEEISPRRKSFPTYTPEGNR